MAETFSFTLAPVLLTLMDDVSVTTEFRSCDLHYYYIFPKYLVTAHCGPSFFYLVMRMFFMFYGREFPRRGIFMSKRNSDPDESFFEKIKITPHSFCKHISWISSRVVKIRKLIVYIDFLYAHNDLCSCFFHIFILLSFFALLFNRP